MRTVDKPDRHYKIEFSRNIGEILNIDFINITFEIRLQHRVLSIIIAFIDSGVDGQTSTETG